MNAALKHWREAATVILAAGSRHRPTHGAPPARDAPTHLPAGCEFDYQVLLLQRGGRSGFMPGAHVFPGGLLDASDLSAEWLPVFSRSHREPRFGLQEVRQPPGTRPPLFSTDRRRLGSPVPGEVALRLCAVRETFEECGVLLAVPRVEEDRLLDSLHSGGAPRMWGALQGAERGELARWRALVIQDPANFLRMCRELELLPNIWALHEWGNWLTPVGLGGAQRRYDTAFFMCCLEHTPHAGQDHKEIVHLKWSPPSEVLLRYQARELWIAPPQFYDLSRMCRYPSLRDLHAFASARAAEGCERWLPFRLVSDQTYISVLPGDHLYPEDVSGQKTEDISLKTEDISLKTETDVSGQKTDVSPGPPALHRIVFQDPYTAAVEMTITPKYKHLQPLLGPLRGPASQL